MTIPFVVKNNKVLLIIAVSFIMTACPFNSSFEVGKALANDQKLIGNWTPITTDSLEQMSFQVKELDLKNYEITWKIERASSSDTLNILGAIRELKTRERLLQIKFKNSSFSYFKYRLHGDTLTIKYIHQEAVGGDFIDQKALENFLSSKEESDWNGEMHLIKSSAH